MNSSCIKGHLRAQVKPGLLPELMDETLTSQAPHRLTSQALVANLADAREREET